MNSDTIYEEKIFAKFIGGLLGAISVVMLIILVYQVMVEPLEEETWATWLFLIIFLAMLFLTIIFARFIIRITYQGISVGFGFVKKRIPWENIEDCEIDKTSAIKYGGAGIRMARVKGEWVLVYNVIGGSRCVLKLKEGKFKKFVFSTKNPEEVLNVIKGQLAISMH
jgi:hypothetical protein